MASLSPVQVYAAYLSCEDVIQMQLNPASLLGCLSVAILLPLLA